MGVAAKGQGWQVLLYPPRNARGARLRWFILPIMCYKTRGIALHYIKYSETSIIARIFTELFGRQTYLIQGVRARKPKHSIALFQPLMPLDMVVYHKKQASIQRVVEVKCHVPISNILESVSKAATATFLSELLARVLHEEAQNESLFRFFLRAVIALNELETSHALFHLYFMLHLCSYLGFGVKGAQEIDKQLVRLGLHQAFSPEETALLDALLANDLDPKPFPNKQVRRRLTASVVKFYQLHIDSLDTFKSLKVLQEMNS